MQGKARILSVVKIDKLSFGADGVAFDSMKEISKVIGKYYEESNNNDKFNNLYRSVTPTKQRREGYEDFNHNLQMIPLGQFLMFLKELRNVTGQNLNVYEIHLAKDILLCDNTNCHIETLKSHEYSNGYHAYTESADSPNTLYISRKKDLNSNGKLKLRIKFYNKVKQILHKEKIENLPLKESIDDPELETKFIDGKEVLPLKDLNMLRCEIELREENLPYSTMDEMIEAIENDTFQDTVEKYCNKMLNKAVFAEPKQKTSFSKLKQIAIKLMHESKRNYKTLFDNIGMSREYNYFKKAKEAVTREDSPCFKELREKLVGE